MADLSTWVVSSENKDRGLVLLFPLFFSGLGLRLCVENSIHQTEVPLQKFGDLPERMAQHLTRARSDNTNIKYLSYYKRWERFITSKGGSALPASPVHIALYLTELIDSKSSFNVISATVYSIKWMHSLKGLTDPTDNSFVLNMLESAKRTLSRPVCKKEPLTNEAIRELCQHHAGSNDLIIVRDICMILLGYSGFLRFNEISSLCCNDVKFYDNYFSLFIRKSKTDQYRHGNHVVIHKGASSTCPYLMLKRYLEISDQKCTDAKFLFRPCFRSGSSCKLIYKNKPLSYSRARECILMRLRPFTGDSNIGLHSLRAGGATKAANSEVNERCWKRHGRWKSDTSKDGYVADSLESRLEVSKSLEL